MAVDNEYVHQIIQKILDNNSTGDLNNRLWGGWREINARREAGGATCGDENLAAADHYLFMRAMSFEVSPALSQSLVALVQGYDGAYKGIAEIIKRFTGKNLVFETGKCPPTGFSFMVILWGHTGIRDGDIDFVTRSSGRLTAPKRPLLW